MMYAQSGVLGNDEVPAVITQRDGVRVGMRTRAMHNGAAENRVDIAALTPRDLYALGTVVHSQRPPNAQDLEF